MQGGVGVVGPCEQYVTYIQVLISLLTGPSGYCLLDITGEDLTALRFDDTGMNVAVGTSNGLVGIFDLRSQKPMIVKDHMYGSK